MLPEIEVYFHTLKNVFFLFSLIFSLLLYLILRTFFLVAWLIKRLAKKHSTVDGLLLYMTQCSLVL